ncbi:MAG: hypothetical protein ACREQ5_17310 [Candidatus Dormibacteria bacterium]
MRTPTRQEGGIKGAEAALTSLRASHETLAEAVTRVGQISAAGGREDRRRLLVEAREQLVAALHLVDGVGIALRRAIG